MNIILKSNYIHISKYTKQCVCFDVKKKVSFKKFLLFYFKLIYCSPLCMFSIRIILERSKFPPYLVVVSNLIKMQMGFVEKF
jgi:hypothetical protein